MNTSAFAESGSSGCFNGCPTKGYNHLLIFVWRYSYLNPWRPSICIVQFMNMHPINNTVYSVICCGLILKKVYIFFRNCVFQEGWQRKCRPSVGTLSECQETALTPPKWGIDEILHVNSCCRTGCLTVLCHPRDLIKNCDRFFRSILTWRRGRIDQEGCTPRARLAIALRLAEPCDSPKRGELGRIIYGSGDLRSRYLLQNECKER